MFSRVLVANRGEIAVRVIRALHELGIEAIAVYSTADSRRCTSRSRTARSASARPPLQKLPPVPNVIAAAQTTGCDAVHPATGSLLKTRRSCARARSDLVFVGPPPEVMERMGDKVRAKAEMRAAGVPLVPGTDAVEGLHELRLAARGLGFPVLVKAAAGGGGKGMRLISADDDLESAYASAGAEADAAFGDGALYLEKALVPAPRRSPGALRRSRRDHHARRARCSIQRRHQKLVEESPSPALAADARDEMESAVERACAAIGYVNAGTFEFLLGPDGGFHFIEVNCRLQVEHPVSELVTGIDIVREQVRIASGERLEVTGRASRRGHAIEIGSTPRIRPEVRPAPGTVTDFRPPLGAGVRVDTAVQSGAEIPPYYDSLIAKVIVWDEARPAAIERALRALSELEVEGIPTTRSSHST